jgi:uncharacterized protein (TIGR03437 family)
LPIRRKAAKRWNSSAKSPHRASIVTVEINRQPVEVLYAGAQSEYLGLDQINLKLPRDLQPGRYPMVIKISDQMSNEVLLKVQ